MTASTYTYVLALTDITPTEKFILLVIADGMGDGFDLDSAADYAAKKTLYDLDTVNASIESLIYESCYIDYNYQWECWYIPVSKQALSQLSQPPAKKSRSRKTVIQHAPALAERDGGWVCRYCKCNLVPTTLNFEYWTSSPGRWVEEVHFEDGSTLSIEPGHRIAAVDHVIAVSRGGDDSLSNLALCCERCNCQKGAKSPEEFLAWLAVRS